MLSCTPAIPKMVFRYPLCRSAVDAAIGAVGNHPAVWSIRIFVLARIKCDLSIFATEMACSSRQRAVELPG
jgi:hypothetical protein